MNDHELVDRLTGELAGFFHRFEQRMDQMEQPTLRDRFAMAALTGLLADNDNVLTTGEKVEQAYELADMMLKVRGGSQ